MRKKVGTLLEEGLVARAKGLARKKGQKLNAFIEEALLAHIEKEESSARWGPSTSESHGGGYASMTEGRMP